MLNKVLAEIGGLSIISDVSTTIDGGKIAWVDYDKKLEFYKSDPHIWTVNSLDGQLTILDVVIGKTVIKTVMRDDELCEEHLKQILDIREGMKDEEIPSSVHE